MLTARGIRFWEQITCRPHPRFPPPTPSRRDPGLGAAIARTIHHLRNASWQDAVNGALPRPSLLRPHIPEGSPLYFCAGCDHLDFPVDSQHTVDGDLCSPCAENYVCCNDGRYRHVDHVYYWDSDEGYHTAPEEGEEPSGIPDYHAHPRRSYVITEQPADHPDPTDPLLLGFEWEYLSQTRSGDAEDIDSLGFAIAEKDGSLESDTGIEIVTGYSQINTVCCWATQLREVINIHGVRDAGLHINVSGLNPRDYAKLITFFNANQALVRAVAGRWGTYYARADSPSLAYWLSRFDGRSSFYGVNPERYSHVHMHNDYAEVRVFNSTTRAETVRARLQFTWSVAHFCMQPGLKLDTPAFLRWFHANIWLHKTCKDLMREYEQFATKASKSHKPKRNPHVPNRDIRQIQPVRDVSQVRVSA